MRRKRSVPVSIFLRLPAEGLFPSPRPSWSSIPTSTCGRSMPTTRTGTTIEKLRGNPVEDSPVNVKKLFDLSGRVAIVTGGSVGLGRQMAEGLAGMGANLVLCARKKERCLQAAEELQKLGVKVLALGCDVKNPANVQEVVDATVSEFGRIDILVNNAGTSWGAPVEEMRL